MISKQFSSFKTNNSSLDYSLAMVKPSGICLSGAFDISRSMARFTVRVHKNKAIYNDNDNHFNNFDKQRRICGQLTITVTTENWNNSETWNNNNKRKTNKQNTPSCRGLVSISSSIILNTSETLNYSQPCVFA